MFDEKSIDNGFLEGLNYIDEIEIRNAFIKFFICIYYILKISY